MRFVVGRYSESRAALAGEASIEVPVHDLFAEDGADLLKMDIEGGEWPILEDPRLSGFAARVVVMEWHEAGCPVADAVGHTRARCSQRRDSFISTTRGGASTPTGCSGPGDDALSAAIVDPAGPLTAGLIRSGVPLPEPRGTARRTLGPRG